MRYNSTWHSGAAGESEGGPERRSVRTNVAIQAIIQSKLKQVSTCDVSGGSQPGEQRDATDVKQTSDDTVSAQ